jgi:peroxiredoxin
MAHSSRSERYGLSKAGGGREPHNRQRTTPRMARRPARPSLLSHLLNWGIPLLIVLVAILFVGICCLGFGTGSTATTGTQTTTTGNTTNTLSQNQAAPDFTLPLLSGGTFQLAAQQGHPVVLYFMSTTCATCAQGSQQLAQEMQAAHVHGAQALAIDVNPGDRPADLQSFVQSVGQPAATNLQWGIDPNGTIATAYGVQTLESMVVINAHGQIIASSSSPLSSAQLTSLLKHAD